MTHKEGNILLNDPTFIFLGQTPLMHGNHNKDPGKERVDDKIQYYKEVDLFGGGQEKCNTNEKHLKEKLEQK